MSVGTLCRMLVFVGMYMGDAAVRDSMANYAGILTMTITHWVGYGWIWVVVVAGIVTLLIGRSVRRTRSRMLGPTI